MAKRTTFFLIMILIISAFLRFSRNRFLQFWSDDEAVHIAVIQRMIVTRRPTLVSPQPTLGTSIGSFFHLVSLPLVLLASSDPNVLLRLFSLIGLATTYLIFLVGQEIKDNKLGLLASFLYATSFLASLYDRRWWPITLTPTFAGLAILSAIRLVKKRQYKYLLVLAFITGTAIHGDPAMIMVGLFSIIILLVYRPIIPKRQWINSALIILFMISPILWFEFRHPGSIFKPLITTINRKHLDNITSADTGFRQSFPLSLDTFNRLLYPIPSQTSEKYLYPGNTNFSSTSNQLTSLIVLLFLIYPFFYHFGHRPKNKKSSLTILLIYWISFFIGLLIFGLIYRHPVQRVYFTLLFPAFFLSVSWTLLKIFRKRPFWITVFIIIYAIINIQSLFKSSYRYPLSDRQQVVNTVIKELGSADFSLYVQGDSYLESGGITRLFALKNKVPRKSYIYAPLDWLYRSHSLYLTDPTNVDQEKIVIITPVDYQLTINHSTSFHQVSGNIQVTIFDNSSGWFNEKMLDQSN